jgi:multiple antibiotic resistance protein
VALRFFGISLPIVQVSGGLAIVGMSWKLLNQEDSDGKDADGSKGLRSLEQKVFYPFTFPISVGPGCIVVMLTLSANALVKGILPSVAAHARIVISVVLLSVAVYFCYGYAPPTITVRLRLGRWRSHARFEYVDSIRHRFATDERFQYQ